MSSSQTFGLNPILKKLLNELPTADQPITVAELCERFDNDEIVLRSLINELIALQLAEEVQTETYALTEKGVEYTSLSELEQRRYEKNHPFLHIVNQYGSEDDYPEYDPCRLPENPIFKRSSVRQFKERDIEPEDIEQLLSAAFAAPSAGNQQPWEFYIVTSRETLQALSKASPYAGPAANAPAAFVVCYRKKLPMPEYAEIDCAIATENVLLELETIGLGGVMLGIAPHRDRMDIVREILKLPDHLEAFTVIPFGYPKNKLPQKNRYEKTRIHYISETRTHH